MAQDADEIGRLNGELNALAEENARLAAALAEQRVLRETFRLRAEREAQLRTLAQEQAIKAEASLAAQAQELRNIAAIPNVAHWCGFGTRSLTQAVERACAAHARDIERLTKERDALKAALQLIADGGPRTGQTTGPMKMYQAQAVAKAALAPPVLSSADPEAK